MNFRKILTEGEKAYLKNEESTFSDFVLLMLFMIAIAVILYVFLSQ